MAPRDRSGDRVVPTISIATSGPGPCARRLSSRRRRGRTRPDARGRTAMLIGELGGVVHHGHFPVVDVGDGVEICGRRRPAGAEGPLPLCLRHVHVAAQPRAKTDQPRIGNDQIACRHQCERAEHGRAPPPPQARVFDHGYGECDCQTRESQDSATRANTLLWVLGAPAPSTSAILIVPCRFNFHPLGARTPRRHPVAPQGFLANRFESCTCHAGQRALTLG